MGEVYRARDTKLQREVAIKTLPAGFATESAHAQREVPHARELCRFRAKKLGVLEWQSKQVSSLQR